MSTDTSQAGEGFTDGLLHKVLRLSLVPQVDYPKGLGRDPTEIHRNTRWVKVSLTAYCTKCFVRLFQRHRVQRCNIRLDADTVDL